MQCNIISDRIKNSEDYINHLSRLYNQFGFGIFRSYWRPLSKEVNIKKETHTGMPKTMSSPALISGESIVSTTSTYMYRYTHLMARQSRQNFEEKTFCLRPSL